MDPLLAVLTCAVIYAIGDYISSKSKAMLPMLFVSGFLLLLGFWTILPTTLLEDTGLFSASVLFAPMFVVHLGTMLNLDEMKKEYKTAIIALSTVVVIAILLFFVGSQVIGQQYAASAAGPITGGLVAVLIVQETAGRHGAGQHCHFCNGFVCPAVICWTTHCGRLFVEGGRRCY